MQIKEIMTNPAVTLNPNDTIFDAARTMRSNNIGALPVVEQGKLVGIVTDRDILIRSTARDFDMEQHPVSEIMTRKVDCVSPYTDVTEATKKMAKDQVRRLPVVDNGEVVGMVTLGDMASCRCFNAEIANTLADISCPCHKKHPTHNVSCDCNAKK